MRFISTRVHGALDYSTAVALLALPRAVRLDRGAARLLRASALAAFAYSLVTRYEWGVLSILPMPTHLAIDISSGATLASSSTLLDVEDERSRRILLAVGLFEITVPLLSKARRG